MRASNQNKRKQPKCGLISMAFAAVGLASGLAWANPNDAVTGLEALAERIGDVPTGSGVAVGQVETATSSGSYAPDENAGQFAGKTIIESSGPSGASSHATQVSKDLFGLARSIAPGIDKAYIYEVNDWISSVLRVGTSGVPLVTPSDQKVVNHSWIGSAGSWDNQILRRADYVVDRDNVIMCVGVNNSEPAYPLMSHGYNSISVGTVDGTHASTDVGSGNDGPGRNKPDMVAPGSSFTSFVTPVVGAAASLLLETARTDSELVGNPDAQRPDVIKAVLLCGADRSNDWTNNPVDAGATRGWTDRGLDEVYGAGSLWVDDSHLILANGETNGQSTVPSENTISAPGWALDTITIGDSSYWRFELTEASDVEFLATWYRKTNTVFSTSYVADFDLLLWSVSGNDLNSLLGQGPRVFGGNVTSESAIDNVELIHATNLAPGEYVLQVSRVDGTSNATSDVAVAWKIPESSEVVLVGDFNNDNIVDISDFSIFLVNFGISCDLGDACVGDLNGDRTVNISDFSIFLVNFGTTAGG
ncbi:MAG: hypothetical protein P8J86_02045 [Phycisphaerales bacterium]|nr:hypothetical protein [Phycisphaerales bacterium]